MSNIPFAELAMTHLEQDLKHVMSLRPDIAQKILTSTELTEYQLWLIDNFRDKRRSSNSDKTISAFPNISRNTNIRNYMDTVATSSIRSVPFAMEDISRENQEILSNHDISVGRMLRYFPAHWHANDCFEIYYSLSGSCPVHFKDEVITVKPGTVLVVAPSIVHATPCYADDNVLLYFMIRRSTFDHVFWNQLPTDSLMAAFFQQALGNQHTTAYLHFETGNDQDISLLLYHIYQEYRRSERYGPQMLNALMSTFFVLLLRRYEGTARLPRRSDFFWKHEFSAILTYIQSNFATATIKSVAQHFHYSDRQIGRIVHSCTGLTFADLMLKLRMDQAVKLLQQKDASVDAIALSVGYASASTFCRAFAKYYGCTPREYETRTHSQADA